MRTLAAKDTGHSLAGGGKIEDIIGDGAGGKICGFGIELGQGLEAGAGFLLRPFLSQSAAPQLLPNEGEEDCLGFAFVGIEKVFGGGPAPFGTVRFVSDNGRNARR